MIALLFKSQSLVVVHPCNFKEAFNVNRARNLGLEIGFEHGADWVFLLDGCTFVTNDSLNLLSSFVQKEKSHVIHFTPTVRLEQLVTLNSNLSYDHLFPFFTGLQEAHIGIKREFYVQQSRIESRSGLKFFPEGKLYGNRDKLQLLGRLFSELGEDQIHCKSVFIGYHRTKSKSPTDDYDIIRECGFAIRLPYYLDDSAPIDQHIPQKWRQRRRNLSIKNFVKKLEKIEDNFIWDKVFGPKLRWQKRLNYWWFLCFPINFNHINKFIQIA